nr:hypothetical protein BaRGS_001993 [Batillaria attramentaria]
MTKTIFNPDKYDSSIRPFIGKSNTPVVVEIDVVLNSVGPVNEIDMTWTSSFYMRQEWTDPRLIVDDYNGTVTLGHDQVSSLWLPDVFFSDSKEGRAHVLTVPNKMLRVTAKTGRILYSQRLTIITNCAMDLEKFPFDRQICNITMESYSHTTDDLVLQWSSTRGATTVLPTAYIPDFNIEDVTVDDCTAVYATGTYPCLRATVYFRREIYFYLTETYVPSILIVILSWASFWIDHEAVPARISVGLLTVLTITTQLSGSRSQLPRVPYIKAIDVWMSTNLVFVFAAYMEYAVVTVLSRRFKKNSARSAAVSTGSIRSSSQVTIQESSLTTDSTASLTPNCTPKKGKFRINDKEAAEAKDTGRLVDQRSRFLFPIAYFIFNIVYWVYYLASQAT